MATAYAEILAPRVRLDVKELKDSGQGEVTNATSGETVTFNKTFVEIKGIVVTARYNASYPVFAVYDYEDVPDPTEFTVYIYRTDTGVRTTGEFRWEATGI